VDVSSIVSAKTLKVKDSLDPRRKHADTAQVSTAPFPEVSGTPPSILSRRLYVLNERIHHLLDFFFFQTTVITISFIGGPTFVVGAFLVSVFYYQGEWVGRPALFLYLSFLPVAKVEQQDCYDDSNLIPFRFTARPAEI
jgi:hypothetical protein